MHQKLHLVVVVVDDPLDCNRRPKNPNWSSSSLANPSFFPSWSSAGKSANSSLMLAVSKDEGYCLFSALAPARASSTKAVMGRNFRKIAMVDVINTRDKIKEKRIMRRSECVGDKKQKVSMYSVVCPSYSLVKL